VLSESAAEHVAAQSDPTVMPSVQQLQMNPSRSAAQEVRLCHLAVRALAQLASSTAGLSGLDDLRRGSVAGRGPEGMLAACLHEWASARVSISGKVLPARADARARSDSIEDEEGCTNAMGVIELQRASAVVLAAWQDMDDDE